MSREDWKGKVKLKTFLSLHSYTTLLVSDIFVPYFLARLHCTRIRVEATRGIIFLPFMLLPPPVYVLYTSRYLPTFLTLWPGRQTRVFSSSSFRLTHPREIGPEVVIHFVILTTHWWWWRHNHEAAAEKYKEEHLFPPSISFHQMHFSLFEFVEFIHSRQLHTYTSKEIS